MLSSGCAKFSDHLVLDVDGRCHLSILRQVEFRLHHAADNTIGDDIPLVALARKKQGSVRSALLTGEGARGRGRRLSPLPQIALLEASPPAGAVPPTCSSRVNGFQEHSQLGCRPELRVALASGLEPRIHNSYHAGALLSMHKQPLTRSEVGTSLGTKPAKHGRKPYCMTQEKARRTKHLAL